MPFVYFGLVFVAMAWLFWIVVWAIVWGIVLLAWPIAVVLGGVALWRAFIGRSWRARFNPPFRPRFGSVARRDDTDENTAFEEYRAETVRRLDEEREKFREFLEKLRRSKDKEAFDRFVAERRARLT